MNIRFKQFVSVCSIATVLLLGASTALSADNTASEVKIEEIDLNQSSNQPSDSTTNQENAGELWDQTKLKTGEAASAAAEYSKVQGTRILEGSKEGLAKGADAVTTGSKKAWDATKEASNKAVDYTVEKASELGEAISETLSDDSSDASVTDRSVGSAQTE
ncbi:MAG: hypothetical protein ACR2QW_02325 [bacterium]